MSILTRYIFKEMIGPTLLGFGFYTSIILTQRLFDMAGLIIKRSLPGAVVGNLLLWSLPHVIVLTVPMSLLFGILIAVGRLSSDSEIIAMRALGLSTRTIYRPVFLFSFLVFLLSLYLMNYVTPKGNAQFQSIKAEILTSSVEKEVKPRIFFDQYENVTIYVNDVEAQTGRWKGVFVADTRGDDDERDSVTGNDLSAEVAASRQDDQAVGALAQRGGQRVIVAESGNLAVSRPDPRTRDRQIWMNLNAAENHTWDPRKPDRYDLTTNASQRILLPTIGDGPSPNKLARSLREMDLKELLVQERELRRSSDRMTYNLARVEIHKKFAIPFACIAFGVLGLPLGITNRRGGKSSGFSLSIAIILFYYVMINNGEQLAANGKISPAVGMWSANLILLGLGIYLLSRANRDTGAQRSGAGAVRRLFAKLASPFRRRRAAMTTTSVADDEPSVLNRLDVTFPNILDRYILKEFGKILALVLVSVVALFVIVDYTEIARDVRANDIPWHVVVAYFRFHIFQVLHWTLPISVLVATLVTFGMLAKNNEVTAIKSGGVSLYRVAMPIIAVAVLISVLSYFILDFILPYSNERVSALKRTIEGKAPITASAQQKQWFVGKGRYLINFLSYDAGTQALSQVQVFEFAPTEFRLTRRVYAERAHWNGKQWEFENGWMRSFQDDKTSTFTTIKQPVALFYSEKPDDFATEVKAPDQMTFAQLRRYIDTVKNAGYSADDLSVELYTKTSWPAISIVMALIALPFAFKIGKRGTLYGIGIALVLGILYTMFFAIFTQYGEVGNLPPLLSAWAANVLFAIAAVYLFLNVET